MPYSIRFSNIAAGQFNKLKNKKLKERIACALEYLAKEPLLGKSLKAEFKGLYSYRVGDYRIIYGLHHKERKYLDIIRIDHRREVYR